MKETTNHKIPYPEPTDPNTLAAYYEGIAEKVEEELDDIAPSQIATAGAGDEGKLLIVQDTGAPAFKALSGDVTINAAGVAEIGAGKVGTAELGEKAVTTAKVNDKSITLAKLAEGLGLTEGYFADGAVTSRKAKLTSGLVSASEDLTLGTSYATVPGTTLEITPAVASYLNLYAVFNLNLSPSAVGANISGTISVDGVDQEDAASWGQGGTTQVWLAMTLSQVYQIPLTAAKHTIGMRGKKGAPAANAIMEEGTRYLWYLTAQ